MDPLSQAALGGAAAVAGCKLRPWIRAAALAGAIGGMLADVDVMFHSDSDPLFGLMLHRHFTHSLAFVPIGGLGAALCAWPLMWKKLAFKWIYLFATLGYLTHGLLDAMTTYGTHLFWPFTQHREAWNTVSVVDPLYTLPLLALLVAAVVKHNRRLAVIGLIWSLLYLGFGWLQRERVESALPALAGTRGHAVKRAEVMPSFGNTIVWRVIYQSGDRLYVNGARAGLGAVTWFEGGSVEALDTQKTLAALPEGSPLRHDIERFDRFANGWLALLPDSPYFVADMRYSALPNSTDPFWMLRFDPARPENHASFERHTNPEGRRVKMLWEMVRRGGPLPE